MRLHPYLLTLLSKLRSKIIKPIYINSGYRCTKENTKVGGVNNSYHLYGMAVDISVRNISMYDLALIADLAGFTGIGLYKNFLHLDIRKNKYHWTV